MVVVGFLFSPFIKLGAGQPLGRFTVSPLAVKLFRLAYLRFGRRSNLRLGLVVIRRLVVNLVDFGRSCGGWFIGGRFGLVIAAFTDEPARKPALVLAARFTPFRAQFSRNPVAAQHFYPSFYCGFISGKGWRSVDE